MSKVILIITDNLPDQINGVVTTFKNLEVQAEMDGYKIVYIDPRQFHHINAPGYPEVKISLPIGIGKKIEAVNADHIHIATEGPIGLAGRLYLDRTNKVYNTSYHTKFPEFLNEIYGIPTSYTYRYVRWFHKHSGVVLTTTQTMVTDLQSNGFDGNIVPWTRGVDRSNLSPTIKHPTNKVPVVLYVGRVSKEKNLEALCQLDNYDIRIVGDGPDRERLSAAYPHINFLGYKHGTDLANEYISADVFVFPSKTDTFGIVIIEALSVGTPVAAYPVPGPIDILDEVTGVMDEDLEVAVGRALLLDRDQVKRSSCKWTWEECWNIFQDKLQ
jgi:glycosyltransferase involved in cell wall biosynthesis